LRDGWILNFFRAINFVLGLCLTSSCSSSSAAAVAYSANILCKHNLISLQPSPQVEVVNFAYKSWKSVSIF
jgi:hypothetical protein